MQALKAKAVFVEMLVVASCNIFPCKYVEDVDLQPSSQSLDMWNGSKVKPVGTCTLPVVNLRNNTKYKVRLLLSRRV